MSRVLVASLVASLLTMASLGGVAWAAPDFALKEPSVVLIDQATGAVLYAKNPDRPFPPGDLAQLMTAEVIFDALDGGSIKPDDAYRVSDHAWRTGGAKAKGPKMFAAPRSEISVEDLLTGLAVTDGDDAAIVLAEGSSGSEDAFAGKMNAEAAALGMATTHFADPAGLDLTASHTTAADMAKLAFRIVEGHPDRMRYFSIPDFTWSKIRQVNKNLLLAANVGADGFKIAKFDKSAALVGTATRDGRRLVVVLMGARDAKQASDDAARLIEWGFSGFTAKALFKKNEIVGSAQVYGGASGSVPLAVERDLVGMAPRGAGAGRLTGRIDYRGPLAAPVSAGVEVARLKVYGGDQLVLDAPLRTAAAVAAGPLPIRAWDSAVEYVTGRIRKAFAKIQ